MSDTLGNLLFYTNGVQVYNKNYQKMCGSDTLNQGYYSWGYCDLGCRINQGVISLPQPGHSNTYYLFHSRVPNTDIDGHKEGVYYSTIDISQDNGLGCVTSLRNPIITNDSLDGRMTACRHANGRDWWIIVFRFKTGEYMPILLDPQGVHLTTWHRAAPKSLFTFHGSLGQSCFSPDGNYFATNTSLSQLGGYFSLYHFDRCNGSLSLRDTLYYNNDYGYYVSPGTAFAQNSTKLYFNNYEHIYQYDLNSAQSIKLALDTVAIYDGYTYVIPNTPPSVGTLYTSFRLAQLAPDGKIYLSSSTSTNCLHVIDKPDEAGAACHVIQRGLALAYWNLLSLPNYPNFRLGSLDGSSCDTLGIDNVVATAALPRKEEIAKVFPNPANDILNIETKNNTIFLSYKIYDILGREVQTGTATNAISTQKLQNGIYFLSINTLATDGTHGLGGGAIKIIVQHP